MGGPPRHSVHYGAGLLQGRLARNQKQWAASFPLGRMGAPEDVALATLYLASESSSWLTDVTLDVAGAR